MVATISKQFIEGQLPIPRLHEFQDNYLYQDLQGWLRRRTLELSFHYENVESFARDCGYDGPPFIWDEERRFWIRAELDAAFFHLYLGTPEEWTRTGSPELLESFPTPRHAVDYIMETFPIVKRKDEKAHGSYRTKEAILGIYDTMAGAIRTGQPYQNRIVRLLVDKVEIREDGMEVALRGEGLGSVVGEITGIFEQANGRNAR